MLKLINRILYFQLFLLISIWQMHIQGPMRIKNKVYKRHYNFGLIIHKEQIVKLKLNTTLLD